MTSFISAPQLAAHNSFASPFFGLFARSAASYVPVYVISAWVLLALAAVALWIFQHKKRALDLRLEQAHELAKQRAEERDLAQQELFRRLYEEQELNKEKLQFQSQLSEYEKYAALARLALGAAHEVNNPLLGILSHLELELREVTDPEQRAEIEQCIAGARRISGTLRGLVNYARPGPLVLSKLGLNRLVADTLSFLEGQPMLRGKVVENQVPLDLPQIRADATQLAQVFMNLLLNAAEATPEGGRITVSASKLTFQESVEVRVSDTGCGIPPDILPHVFDPFFTTKKGKGTGLGLSISQAYLRSHDGEIRADSVVGHGTTITVTLPIRQELPDEAAKAESGMVV